MKFTNNEIATYLFCAQLTQTNTRPLTILEWNTVVKSLGERKLKPEILFEMHAAELNELLVKATEAQKERIIKKILSRQKLGISMMELEEIIHQGYSIMFRSQMPARLKKLTQNFLPAFFYYAGDPTILLNRTLGVVGARDANNDELSKTKEIGKEAADKGVVIISGGARGIDSAAVEAALENGGKAVVFPNDGIGKWIKKSEIRNYISTGNLLLMSTQKINAPFTGAYAMQRNKYIHAPSDAVLVASSKISGKKRSGTWEGVVENIKYNWSPIYVIGNSEGIEKLKDENQAVEFSSFEEIFKQSQSSNQKNTEEIDEEIDSLIELAVSKGWNLEALNKKFLKSSSDYFNKPPVAEYIREDNRSEEAEAHQQLNIEEYLRNTSG